MRLLKLLEYPHDEIVAALVSQYGVTEDEANRLIGE